MHVIPEIAVPARNLPAQKRARIARVLKEKIIPEYVGAPVAIFSEKYRQVYKLASFLRQEELGALWNSLRVEEEGLFARFAENFTSMNPMSAIEHTDRVGWRFIFRDAQNLIQYMKNDGGYLTQKIEGRMMALDGGDNVRATTPKEYDYEVKLAAGGWEATRHYHEYSAIALAFERGQLKETGAADRKLDSQMRHIDVVFDVMGRFLKKDGVEAAAFPGRATHGIGKARSSLTTALILARMPNGAYVSDNMTPLDICAMYVEGHIKNGLEGKKLAKTMANVEKLGAEGRGLLLQKIRKNEDDLYHKWYKRLLKDNEETANGVIDLTRRGDGMIIVLNGSKLGITLALADKMMAEFARIEEIASLCMPPGGEALSAVEALAGRKRLVARVIAEAESQMVQMGEPCEESLLHL